MMKVQPFAASARPGQRLTTPVVIRGFDNRHWKYAVFPAFAAPASRVPHDTQPCEGRRPVLATVFMGTSRHCQGNESRLTRHRPQYLHEISGVHGGALATPFDGAFSFRRVGELTHEIEGEMADHGHVLGSVAYAQA
jgi:hypothetical protein